MLRSLPTCTVAAPTSKTAATTLERSHSRTISKQAKKLRSASRDLRLIFSSSSSWPKRTVAAYVVAFVSCAVAVWFVRSLYIERGFGYDFGQCLFKSAGSLDHYSRSTSQYKSISEVLASSQRRGFFSANFPTDKDFSHNYTAYYDKLLAPYAKTANAVLEVGVKKGGSVQMLREYFQAQTFIYGMDIDPAVPTFVADAHIKILVMDSRRSETVERALRGLKFDVIIDDGRHTRNSIMQTFQNLRPFLSESGIYIIEDWGVANKAFQSHRPGDNMTMFADSSIVESLLIVAPANSLANSALRHMKVATAQK